MAHSGLHHTKKGEDPGQRQIVASIDDGVDYGQPDFKTAVWREGTADHDIDFGGQDNDHGEESEEEKEKTRKLALPKKTKSASVVDPNVLREIALRDNEERDLTETGDRGNSEEECLVIDFHSKAVRLHVKLEVLNEESDTGMWNGLMTQLEKHGGILEPREHKFQDLRTVGCHQKSLTIGEDMFQRSAQVHPYWMRLIIEVVGICTRSHPNMRKGNILVIKHQREQLLLLKMLTVKE